ncbi:MAG TPA: hypothetical protein VLD39_01995, partial [Gammaproteobacteria bacterium]|nr:hypothetical protein [Gammaproteobacteria bacterium]
MCIRLLSRGPLEQISGGYLYNRYLIEFLREAGADVAYHGVPPDPRSLVASDVLVVDSLVVGEMATRLLTSPAEIVLLLHMLPDMAGPGSAGRALFEALCRRSRLIVTGKSTLTLLRRAIADPSLEAVTIEPGVPDYWLAKARYAPSARSLLGIANYVRGKGLLRMIDVLCELRDLPWTLTLHGNDELDPAYFDAVSRSVESRGLMERVELAGPIPHAAVNVKMLESDLLVHFSARESYSMVTAEAIVAGL